MSLSSEVVPITTRGSDQDREVPPFPESLGGAIRTGKCLLSPSHSGERSGPGSASFPRVTRGSDQDREVPPFPESLGGAIRTEQRSLIRLRCRARRARCRYGCDDLQELGKLFRERAPERPKCMKPTLAPFPRSSVIRSVRRIARQNCAGVRKIKKESEERFLAPRMLPE